MSPIARILQLVLMAAGFAAIGYAALWDMDDATGWKCQVMEIRQQQTQVCDTEDGVQTPIILGMAGIALEIAGVSVAVGARRTDRAPRPAVPVSFPAAPAPYPAAPAAPVGYPPAQPGTPPRPY
ncbi:hypothetical protein F4556_000848 [Kitasatospora gansuensis]|uniref:Uncharacterized protein n=1 Tax=Kitasatospora gansuensis TaxID=258050 RepID=A0A7W7WFU5_9ACTN|nr:hypothetical protein [Kitasatospora gansuensis]MBB4945313.1 hypothetical protein [Kitasatospora gansuensis]